jgi:hypothetical protein
VIQVRFQGNPVGLWSLLDELKAEGLDVRFDPPPDVGGHVSTRVDVILAVIANAVPGDDEVSATDMTAATERALRRWRIRHPQQDATMTDAD